VTPVQLPRRDRPWVGWYGFRRWRRARPFWGGLLTALAGLEIFGTTQMSLSGLTFQMGPTGFLSWLIPAILVTCGLLIWFRPQQRIFYAVVAAVTALFSLIGVNLGGFFLGLMLGAVGSALGFAWVPGAAPTVPPGGGSAADGSERHEPAPDEGAPDGPTDAEDGRDESAGSEPAARDMRTRGADSDLLDRETAGNPPLPSSRPSSKS
jgi:hypothetical protein